MKYIKAADLQMDPWTDQIFKAESFEDLMKQIMTFMENDPNASEAAKSFTKEDEEAWNIATKELWNNTPEV